MVTFVCYHCDRTLKKKQVDGHIRFCGQPTKLACIDCKKWFNAEEQKAHTSCISEQEMWHGQFYKKKGEPQAAQAAPQPQAPAVVKPAAKKPVIEETDTESEAPSEPEPQSENEAAQEEAVEAAEPQLEWAGWKKTIRRLVKYAPGHSLPKKKLLKRLRRLYTAKNVDGSAQSFDYATFKARVNAKIKKTKYVIETGNALAYEKS